MSEKQGEAYRKEIETALRDAQQSIQGAAKLGFSVIDLYEGSVLETLRLTRRVAELEKERDEWREKTLQSMAQTDAALELAKQNREMAMRLLVSLSEKKGGEG